MRVGGLSPWDVGWGWDWEGFELEGWMARGYFDKYLREEDDDVSAALVTHVGFGGWFW